MDDSNVRYPALRDLATGERLTAFRYRNWPCLVPGCTGRLRGSPPAGAPTLNQIHAIGVSAHYYCNGVMHHHHVDHWPPGIHQDSDGPIALTLTLAPEDQ
jgi:hypothetical protein